MQWSSGSSPYYYVVQKLLLLSLCLQGPLIPEVLTSAVSVTLWLFCGLLCVLAAP